MSKITISTLSNGLRVHRIPVAGTRSVTLLAAFDAGARSERAEENGMAHFLEHLVFKGGEKFPHYRDVNDTAEVAEPKPIVAVDPDLERLLAEEEEIERRTRGEHHETPHFPKDG